MARESVLEREETEKEKKRKREREKEKEKKKGSVFVAEYVRYLDIDRYS